MPVSYQRKLPTTGYWIFICNTSLWFADQFLRSDRTRLYYKISITIATILDQASSEYSDATMTVGQHASETATQNCKRVSMRSWG